MADSQGLESDPDVKKLCFSSFVHGWYQDFIPLFLYSIYRSYPDHDCLIFLREYLCRNNIISLEALRKKYDHFRLVEEYREVDCTYVKHLPAVRFLIPGEAFQEYDFLYMTDIDFLILQEYDLTFYDYYWEHCRFTGLPFSNSFFTDHLNRTRLTGLQFMVVKPYYESMNPIMQRVIGGDPYCQSIIDSLAFDEQCLYYMANQTFDLSLLNGYSRPHHGIHFGHVREKAMGSSFIKKTRHLLWDQHQVTLAEMWEDDLFQLIYGNLGSEARQVVDRFFQLFRRPRSFL